MITDATTQLFKGQVVLYSDLSPWETATVKEIPSSNEVVLVFDADFDIGSEPLTVSIDGIRTINWNQNETTRQAREGADLAQV